jgi:AmiR/NasT family two-component response regulator
VDQDKAFEMLRDHSQRSNRKVIEVAESIVQSHSLLLPPLGSGGEAP